MDPQSVGVLLAFGVGAFYYHSSMPYLALSSALLGLAYFFRSKLIGLLDIPVSLFRITAKDNFKKGFGNLHLVDDEIALLPQLHRAVPIASLEITYFESKEYSIVAHIEVVLPKGWTLEALPRTTPIAVLLPATGDEGFSYRRKMFAEPLLHHGICSIILQIPFYGKRRMPEQKTSGLLYASDSSPQMIGTAWEAIGIIQYLKNKLNHNGPVVFAGLSFGGTTTAATALLAPFDVAAVSLVPAHSPTAAYCVGVLRKCVDWDALNNDSKKLFDEFAKFSIERVASVAAESTACVNKKLFYYQISCPDDHYIYIESQHATLAAMKAFPATKTAEIEYAAGGHAAAFVLHSGAVVRNIVKAVKSWSK